MLSIITVKDLFIIVLGLALLMLWLFLHRKGKKNEGLFVNLNDKDYPMHELYYIGYELIQKLNLQFKSEAHRKIRKNIQILYGDKYVDYYLRVSYSQRFTMALTLALFAMPVYCFTRNAGYFLLVMVFSLAAFYYYGTVFEEMISNRNEELLSDFPDVVTKLALLTNAGMILHEAWIKVSESNDTLIYQEMRESVNQMNNGVAEVDALFNFGQRCNIPEIKKFTSTIIQGLTRGNQELSSMLTQQSKEVWNTRQQTLRRKGEQANSKLMLPLALTFIGIIIMVIVPILSSLGV